jgi:hypothetical protein
MRVFHCPASSLRLDSPSAWRPRLPSEQAVSQLVRSWSGWRWIELSTPHLSMITNANSVGDLLLARCERGCRARGSRQNQSWQVLYDAPQILSFATARVRQIHSLEKQRPHCGKAHSFGDWIGNVN